MFNRSQKICGFCRNKECQKSFKNTSTMSLFWNGIFGNLHNTADLSESFNQCFVQGNWHLDVKNFDYQENVWYCLRKGLICSWRMKILIVYIRKTSLTPTLNQIQLVLPQQKVTWRMLLMVSMQLQVT